MADEWVKQPDGSFVNAGFDELKGLFTYETAVDIAPVIESNLERQTDYAQNGFFKETRDSRHIGEIPTIAYYRDIMPKYRALEAAGVTGNELRIKKGKILRDYLELHKEFRVVDKLVHHNVNETNIIIK